MVSSLATVQGTTERLLALSEVSEELVREPLLRLMSIRGHSSAERASALQAWLQPPIRRHQHPEGQDRGEGPVRGSLLCTGRYGEPDQGAATRSLRRPDLAPHDAGQPAAGVLLGLRGCCGPDHPQVRAESHKAGEGSGRDHPHSAAEIAGSVRVTSRKIWVSLSSVYPWRELFKRVARNLAAAEPLHAAPW